MITIVKVIGNNRMIGLHHSFFTLELKIDRSAIFKQHVYKVKGLNFLLRSVSDAKPNDNTTEQDNYLMRFILLTDDHKNYIKDSKLLIGKELVDL